MRYLLFIALYTTAVVAVPHGVLSAPGVYEDHDHAAHEGHRHDEEGPHGFSPRDKLSEESKSSTRSK